VSSQLPYRISKIMPFGSHLKFILALTAFALPVPVLAVVSVCDHEVEHLIQSFTGGSHPVGAALAAGLHPSTLYLVEEAAMQMEWEFLHNLPESERLRIGFFGKRSESTKRALYEGAHSRLKRIYFLGHAE
jgi:hypothetical protein